MLKINPILLMKSHLLLFLLLLSSSILKAQMPSRADRVWMAVADSLYVIHPAQTQTEVKAGWKIADVAETKSKSTRYVWGGLSRQLSPSTQPQFVINTQGCMLHDFIIVKLKAKKQYRLFPKANPLYCQPLFIDLTTFRIELLSDDRYRVTPLQPLQPGEYVIINTAVKAVNEQGDFMVYGFTVKK